MGVRTFGVINAPGSQVQEVTSPRPAVPGQVGTALIFGAFDRGAVGAPRVRPVEVSDSNVLRRRGLFTPTETAADAMRDFLKHAQGAGKLYTVRVTDGDGAAATGTLRSRDCPRGRLYLLPDILTPDALSWTVQWPGRAGGKRKFRGGLLSGVPSITATTLTTGQAMTKDELAGGTLYLRGVSARSYTIVSNTAAGVITVTPESDMATDHAEGTPANLYWAAKVVNLEATDSRRRAVAVEVVPRGQRRPSEEFGLRVLIDREIVKDWPDLRMATKAGSLEAETTINGDEGNLEIEVSNDWTGSDLPKARPANWAGVVADGGVGALTLTLDVIEWDRTGTGNGYPTAFNYGSDLQEDEITITVLPGAATFSVSSQLFSDMPNGTIGVAYTGHTTHAQSIGFTVTNGGVVFLAGDTITIRVKALPTDGSLKDARLYPDADGTNAGKSFRVLSNTSRTVTIAAGDLTTLCTEPVEAAVATITAGPWDCDPALTVTGIEIDGIALTVPTFTTSIAAALTPATLVTEWKAHDPRLWGWVDATTGKAHLGSRSTGGRSSFKFTGGTAVGVFMPPAQLVHGTDGSLVVLDYAQESGGGKDGLADLADADFLGAMDVTGSVAEILPENTGLIQVLVPGRTSDAVVQAARDLAAQINGVYIPDMPTGITTEEAAIGWVQNNLGRSDFVAPVWPSWYYGDRTETQESDVLMPVCGSVAGLQSRSWATDGMGKAPAGTSLELIGVKRWLKDDPKSEPDAEQINLSGIRTLCKRGGARPVIWGDRIPGETEIWFHKRAVMSQIGRELLYPGNFDQFIFMINDMKMWGALKSVVSELLRPRWRAGWMSLDLPFEQAVQVKIDAETTPSDVQRAGRVVCAVGLVLPDTVEQVIFRLSQAGMTEG